MRVFSTCIKIMKRNKGTFLIYAAVFFIMLVLGGIFYSDETVRDFTQEKPAYALFCRDEETALTAGIRSVLEQKGELVELEDSREAWMDAGFYGIVDGIFLIPEGFGEDFENQEAPYVELWQKPLSAAGYYLEAEVNQYLNLVRLQQEVMGSDINAAAKAAVHSMKQETKTEMLHYLDTKEVSKNIRQYLRFLPYVLLSMCISCVGMVFMSFHRPAIRMRNFCAPVSSTRFALEKLLYAIVVGVVFWAVLNVAGIVLFYRQWAGIDLRQTGLFLLNGFLQMLVTIAVALFCSVLIRNESIQSFVTNVVSLGICFFGGVFVPVSMMGEGMKKAARFLPVYWYVEEIQQISGLTGFDTVQLTPVYQGFLIQAGFAAAFFCIYLAVNKYQQKEEEDFGSIRTEVERS